MDQVTYKGLTFEPYITNDTIQNRIAEIAREINKQYAESNRCSCVYLTEHFRLPPTCSGR